MAEREVLEGTVISQFLSIKTAYSALQSSDKLSTGKSLRLYSEVLLACLQTPLNAQKIRAFTNETKIPKSELLGLQDTMSYLLYFEKSDFKWNKHQTG